MEPGPEVEAADEEALHDALGLGKGGDHRVGAVGEGADVGRGAVGAENADGKGLGGGVGEGVGVEDEEAGDARGGELGGEEIDDEDPRRDEEDGAAGVEGLALVGGEIEGELGGAGIRVRVWELGEGADDGGSLGR